MGLGEKSKTPLRSAYLNTAIIFLFFSSSFLSMYFQGVRPIVLRLLSQDSKEKIRPRKHLQKKTSKNLEPNKKGEKKCRQSSWQSLF